MFQPELHAYSLHLSNTFLRCLPSWLLTGDALWSTDLALARLLLSLMKGPSRAFDWVSVAFQDLPT